MYQKIWFSYDSSWVGYKIADQEDPYKNVAKIIYNRYTPQAILKNNSNPQKVVDGFYYNTVYHRIWKIIRSKSNV